MRITRSVASSQANELSRQLRLFADHVAARSPPLLTSTLPRSSPFECHSFVPMQAHRAAPRPAVRARQLHRPSDHAPALSWRCGDSGRKIWAGTDGLQPAAVEEQAEEDQGEGPEGEAPPSAAAAQQLVPEQTFFEGAPSITETFIPGLSVLTVVGRRAEKTCVPWAEFVAMGPFRLWTY